MKFENCQGSNDGDTSKYKWPNGQANVDNLATYTNIFHASQKSSMGLVQAEKNMTRQTDRLVRQTDRQTDRLVRQRGTQTDT